MIKILHIPKTGGTTIKRTVVLGYEQHPKGIPWLETLLPDTVICDHFQHLKDDDNQYIFFVRDPVKQFVSHYLFTRYRGKGQYDTDKYWGRPKAPDLMLKYPTLEDFVMDIDNLNFKKMSIRRLRRSIYEITEGPENIRRCRHKILFVGRTENLEEDFKKMQLKMAITNRNMDCTNLLSLKKDYENRTPIKIREKGHLSPAAKSKLRLFLDREYECIDRLKELGFLPEDYLNG